MKKLINDNLLSTNIFYKAEKYKILLDIDTIDKEYNISEKQLIKWYNIVTKPYTIDSIETYLEYVNRRYRTEHYITFISEQIQNTELKTQYEKLKHDYLFSYQQNTFKNKQRNRKRPKNKDIESFKEHLIIDNKLRKKITKTIPIVSDYYRQTDLINKINTKIIDDTKDYIESILNLLGLRHIINNDRILKPFKVNVDIKRLHIKCSANEKDVLKFIRVNNELDNYVHFIISISTLMILYNITLDEIENTLNLHKMIGTKHIEFSYNISEIREINTVLNIDKGIIYEVANRVYDSLTSRQVNKILDIDMSHTITYTKPIPYG